MQAAAPAVLEDFFRRSALAGESRLSRVRIPLALLGVVNILVAAGGPAGLLARGPKYLVMLTALGGLIGFSAWVLRFARRGEGPRWLADASVLVDAVAAFGVVGPSVIWSNAGYHGLLGMPHGLIFPIAAAGGGIRLSRRAVIVSAVANTGLAVLLLGLDRALHPEIAPRPLDDYGFYTIMMVICVAYAWSTASRFRALVAQGGEAMVRAERARAALGVYLSPQIATAALEITTLKPGGARRPAAVLFADLRDFCAWSATLPPERLVEELNAWMEAMVREIRAEGGVVDKFIGDAIMAVWGIPDPHADDAVRAIRAAERMQMALAALNQTRAAAGRPPLRQGIGVHHGDVVAGNVGASDRMQYTVMGEAVNLASRLEQATKEVGVPVLISAEAAAIAQRHPDAPALVEAGTVQARGVVVPLVVYRLDEDPDHRLAKYVSP